MKKVGTRVDAEEKSTKSWFFEDSVDDNSSMRPQNEKIQPELFFFGSVLYVQPVIAILEEVIFFTVFYLHILLL